MARKDSENQKKSMSAGFRGREIFKPLNTGWIDEHVGCVREWVANIFFYRKNDTVIMIDAGYNYARLGEKMKWLDIDPSSIQHILITHQDTDHVGALETDSELLFKDAKIYLSETENRYLTGEVRRKVIHGLYKLPLVKTDNEKVLLKDGQILDIEGIKIECIMVPGHTWGHMVYLIDDEYLFTGDTIWFGPDGGYSFIATLAEDNRLAVKSLEALENNLRKRNGSFRIVTGHTGWTDDLEFAFRHRTELCEPFKKRNMHDPDAIYDGYDESDDTEEKARTKKLTKQIDHIAHKPDSVSDTMKSRYTIEEDGFVGYWHPADGHEGKALIVFPGSGADYELTRKGSEFLAKAGWNRLLVAFAGWDGLPEDPVRTPVEYAEYAVNVLKKAGYEKVGVYGISAGAKYAITAASLIPDISLVIAASPFDYTTEAFRGTKPLFQSTFSYKGEPLPYDPTVTLHRNIVDVLARTALSKKYGMRRMLRGCYEENVQSEEARIKVENMHADFLMQCPGYDDCWPSDEAVPRMEKILKETNYPYRYKATVYKNGSHLLCGDLSESPEYLKSMKNILEAEYRDQQACSKARYDSMYEALEFLEGWK